jgi:hypothetical protein
VPVGFGLAVGGEEMVDVFPGVLGPKGVVRGPQFGGGVQRGPAGSSSSGSRVGVGRIVVVLVVAVGRWPPFCPLPGRGVCCG